MIFGVPLSHVAQHGYKAILVQRDAYLVELARYACSTRESDATGRMCGSSQWARLKRQVVLRSDAFIQSWQLKSPHDGDLREVPQAHRTRDQAITAAYASGGYTVQEIGDSQIPGQQDRAGRGVCPRQKQKKGPDHFFGLPIP